jgi:hypothetical protein
LRRSKVAEKCYGAHPDRDSFAEALRQLRTVLQGRKRKRYGSERFDAKGLAHSFDVRLKQLEKV